MGTRAGLYGRESRAKTKSIEDQLAEARAEAEELGWTVTAELSDKVSASDYARKKRSGWPAVLAAVEARDFDVLVLWEGSRGDRTLATWAAFLDLCRDSNVLIHVVSDARTYDMSIDTDWRTLADAGVDSAHESKKISKRARRGVRLAAKAGRPTSGRCPYGYTRTREWVDGATVVTQHEDPETSDIVREIIRRVGTAEPIAKIMKDLNARGIPTPGSSAGWRRQLIRAIATSPVYVGRRAHVPGRGTGRQGQRQVYDAQWPALVTEAEHYAAVRILEDPERKPKHMRPGRQIYLLTGQVSECGREGCTNPIRTKADAYECQNAHASVPRELADRWVRARAIAYLKREDVYKALRQQAQGSDKTARAAKEEAETLRGRLEMWRRSAAKGETTPESLAAIEADLKVQIAAADKRAEHAGLPPVLRPFAEPGVDVAERWDNSPLAARREILSLFWTIRFMPAGKGRQPEIDERVLMIPVQRKQSK